MVGEQRERHTLRFERTRVGGGSTVEPLGARRRNPDGSAAEAWVTDRVPAGDGVEDAELVFEVVDAPATGTWTPFCEVCAPDGNVAAHRFEAAPASTPGTYTARARVVPSGGDLRFGVSWEAVGDAQTGSVVLRSLRLGPVTLPVGPGRAALGGLDGHLLAWRFVAVDPGNRFGYRYILDDESFYTNTGEPNAVFTFGALEPDGRDQESQIYVCSLSSAGSRNNTHDPLTQPPRVGAPTREILVSDETERLARFDAEPLTLHDFGGVYNERRTIIYYGAPWPFAPNNHRLRHADALV